VARRSRTAQIRRKSRPIGHRNGPGQHRDRAYETLFGIAIASLMGRSPKQMSFVLRPGSRLKLRRPLGPSGRDCVTDGWHDFQFNGKSRSAKLVCSGSRCHEWNGRILPENEQDRRQAASGGDRHWRKEPRKGHQRSNLPSTGRDRVQSDNRTLGYTDEGDSVVRCLQPFPLQDVGDGPVRMDFAVRGRFMVFSRLWVTDLDQPRARLAED
jgi:hypothetical protein